MKLEFSFLHPAMCPGSHSPSQPQSMSLNRDVDDVGCARPPTSSCSGSISGELGFCQRAGADSSVPGQTCRLHFSLASVCR